ncbi:MAG: outer membrane protein assembly factor BamB/tetratricopeptide (TPR) repeat protein, partial [Planctomycetota bacterium]
MSRIPFLPSIALFLGLLPSLAHAASQSALPGNEEDSTNRFFALPLPRAATASAENVVEHLEAGRSNQALTELQRMLEESSHDLLPSGWRSEDAEPSIYPSYPGAAGWARATLLSLAPDVRARYRERFGPAAQDALTGALANLDEGELIRIAQRWPLTFAAETAWWAFGDLEAERGSIETAAAAWNRARALVRSRGGALPAGASERAGMVEALSPRVQTLGQGGSYGSSALLDPDVPRADADQWFMPLDLEPFGRPRSRNGDGYPVQPLLVEDQLLINTSLRVYAVDAFTGLVRWESQPHDSWSFIQSGNRGEFFQNVDRSQVAIGVAAARGIAVATQQLPYSEFSDSSWQGIQIFRRIPERRLFAYDLATGAPLWDHAPNMRWRPASRNFEIQGQNSREQLALVAASPLIVGSRVLVPSYRLDSRIEYHVSCYALDTGEPLWDTQVISGQRERNMFGRASNEFIAAPLVVSGDRIIAQTELGAIAALDLLSGELLWSSEYSQIAVRRNTSYMTPTRVTDWRIAPPVIVDGLVISTPSDSTNLMALELDDGAVRWSIGSFALQNLGRSGSERHSFDLLIGADAEHIYLGGEKIAALHKQGGLRSNFSFSPRWEYLIERAHSSLPSPRPLLTPEVLVIPQPKERLTLDRATGQRINTLSGTWGSQDRGELVLGDGVLYSLGRYGLLGLFDWKTLITRQRVRLAEANESPRVRMDTASLYLRRARSLRENEGKTNEARRFLRDARELIAERVAAADAPAELLASDRAGATLLHELLREEARVLAALTREEDAQKTLREALALAPHPIAVRDTLLQQIDLVRNDRGSERLALLSELEERVGNLELSIAQRESSPNWLISEALLSEDDLKGWDEADIPIALWVRLSRADELARRRKGEEALVELQGAAERYGDLEINKEWTVGQVVHERIARRIAIDGPEVYRRFEAEARTLLEQAQRTADEDIMQAVVERYPFADAAREAEESMLEFNFLARDADRVAELTGVILSRPETDERLAREALVQLGLLLEAQGNKGFLASLLEREAALNPRAEVQVPGVQGVPLSKLALDRAIPRPLPLRPNFDDTLNYMRHEPGLHEPIGLLHEVTNRGTSKVLQIFTVDSRRLAAYDITNPADQAWSFTVPFDVNPSRVAIDENQVLVGSRNSIRAVNSSGRLLWQRRIGMDSIRSLSAANGVVLVLAGSARNEHRITAWDSKEGVRLWQVDLADHLPGAINGWLRPMIGDGHVVVFRKRFAEDSTAVIIDLHRGSVNAVVNLGPYGSKDVLDECAWIEAGNLCVPRFHSRGEMGSTLGVYDLGNGEELWRMG